MDPDLVYPEYVAAEINGRAIEGRVVVRNGASVLVQEACGRLSQCLVARRLAGVWARVCQVVTDRATFAATAGPAEVTVVVGGQRVVLSVPATSFTASGCGWRGTATNYLEVVGLPHLCKIAVTITAVGSKDWGHRPTEYPDPNRFNGVKP